MNYRETIRGIAESNPKTDGGWGALKSPRRRQGFAIALVLCFVVLLTAVVLAFFSKAISQRQVADSSVNQERVDLFAHGALDTIVGDLKQEIVLGSSGSNINIGNLTVTLYTPTTPGNMVPALALGASGTNGTGSLIKISGSAIPFFSAGPIRAAAVSSTTASLNGRTISLARWNTALLLTPTSTTDLTPTPKGAFHAPDWILVDGTGGNPNAPSNSVRGRYAYAIYDEGGLLDVNVAGYPSTLSGTNVAYKNALAYADLTQVGLTGSQANALVNWRNNATLQQPGGYPAYVASNQTGFLTTSGSLIAGQSDHMFVSRQQLIAFINTLSGTSASLQNPLNALQNLSTFSRGLNQPSFQPATNPRRPLIVSDTTKYPGFGNLFGAYAGGNNAYGLDDAINPSFLTVRVTGSFPRNDGTPAVIGEPLVKKRFALSRLAWITFNGPSGSLSPSDPAYQQLVNQGVSAEMIQSGSSSNIANYFGLTWKADPMNSGSCWWYSHGSSTGNILKLAEVQSQNREADFFEILKASIAVGSLGKGAATNHNAAEYTSSPDLPTLMDVAQYNLDTSVDDQVLQIGANIIDQTHADSYPTHIYWPGTAAPYQQNIYGIQSLPYLYRARVLGVNTSDAFISGTSGSGLMLLLPEVWNPSITSSIPTQGPTNFRFLLCGPTSASVAAQGVSVAYWTGGTAAAPPALKAIGQGSSGSWPYSAQGSFDSRRGVSVPVKFDTMPTPVGYTEIDFGTTAAANAAMFANPVFLGGLSGKASSTGKPGPNHNLVSGPYAHYASGGFISDPFASRFPGNGTLNYCGVLLGQFPTTWVLNVSSTPPIPPLTLPLTPGNPVNATAQNASSANYCQLVNQVLTADYILQYQSGGNWVTYQDNQGLIPYQGAVSTLTGSVIDISATSSTGNPTSNQKDNISWMDPRTSRFGSLNSTRSTLNWSMSDSYYGQTNRPGTNWGQGFAVGAPGTGLSSSTSGPDSTGAPSIGWYPGSWNIEVNQNGAKVFAPGFYSENVMGKQSTIQADANYFSDPDGVVRRGMSGWVGIASQGGTTLGLPMAGGTSQSRPFILHRPFKTVGELGYVFSGTPWRNLDFSFPESGCAALLDTFCINDDPSGVVAGKINLNTQSTTAIKAVLAGNASEGANMGDAYKDEASPISNALTSTEIANIATALTTVTSSTGGQLSNVSELVGKWNSTQTTPPPNGINGSLAYTGFSGVLSATNGGFTDPSTVNIQRLRESAIRALSACGQTRVWNLMIDVIAQTGRYRAGETSLNNFAVDGERRYWLHIAIDRYTGDIVDKQLELVEE